MAQTKKSAGAPAKKAGGGDSAQKAGGAKAGGAAKKPSPPKLNERQTKFLNTVHGAGAEGHLAANGNDQKTIDTLAKHKLVKRTGKKDPSSGRFHYVLTKAGEKHLGSSSQAGSGGGGSAAGESGQG